MEDTAVSLAHRYAKYAEEYMDSNQWEKAVDMHFRAAEQFLVATKDAQSQEVMQTLRFMNASHVRQAKDLQRKIAKVAAAHAAATAVAEAAAASAAAAAASATSELQQKQTGRVKKDVASNSASGSSSSGTKSSSPGKGTGRRRDSDGHHQQRQSSEGLSQHHLNLLFHQNVGASEGVIPSQGGGGGGGGGGDTGSGGSYLGTSSEVSSNSSSAMIEESFTLIKGHVKDESDPFNKFWDAVENLVLKISSPVAFTSIPLDGDDPLNPVSGQLNSPTSEDPPSLSPVGTQFPAPGDVAQPQSLENSLKALRHIPANNNSQSLPRPSKLRTDPSPMQESFFIIDSPTQKNAHLKNPSSRSRPTSATEPALLSSSSSSSSFKPASTGLKRVDTAHRTSTKTLEEYAIENQQLKLTLDKLSRRNLKLEKHLEGVMQMSVWTKDVQRSAMQLIKSQDILRPVKHSIQDLSAEKGGALSQRAQMLSLGLQPPAPPVSSAAASYVTSYDQMDPMTIRARLKELEEEVQKLRLENAKQNVLMKKYKQRWEDLKESAKRRRNATSASPDDSRGTDKSRNNDDNPLNPRPRNHHNHHRLLHPGTSASGSGPFSSSSLVGSPSGNINHASSSRPLSNLSRSSSASGPVLSAGNSSYQRRIIMESPGLDSTSFNVPQHAQQSVQPTTNGTISPSSPRMLDSSSSLKVQNHADSGDGHPANVPKVMKNASANSKNSCSVVLSSSTLSEAGGTVELVSSSTTAIDSGSANGCSDSVSTSGDSGSPSSSSSSNPKPSASTSSPLESAS